MSYQENPKRQRAALPEPIEVHKMWASRSNGEAIIVAVKEFEGHTFVDLRRFFTDTEGKLAPTKKGIGIGVHKLREVIQGLMKAERTLCKLGLLDESKP